MKKQNKRLLSILDDLWNASADAFVFFDTLTDWLNRSGVVEGTNNGDETRFAAFFDVPNEYVKRQDQNDEDDRQYAADREAKRAKQSKTIKVSNKRAKVFTVPIEIPSLHVQLTMPYMRLTLEDAAGVPIDLNAHTWIFTDSAGTRHDIHRPLRRDLAQAGRINIPWRGVAPGRAEFQFAERPRGGRWSSNKPNISNQPKPKTEVLLKAVNEITRSLEASGSRPNTIVFDSVSTACDCGGSKLNMPHSHWCSAYPT